MEDHVFTSFCRINFTKKSYFFFIRIDETFVPLILSCSKQVFGVLKHEKLIIREGERFIDKRNEQLNLFEICDELSF